MKFSEISKESWAQLAPYFDTCLLPITGLHGTEPPWEVTKALERLRDAMEWVETPYKGRIVTYPAVHFIGEEDQRKDYLESICSSLKKGGFAFVIAVAVSKEWAELDFRYADAMLVLDTEQNQDKLDFDKKRLQETIESMWRNHR